MQKQEGGEIFKILEFRTMKPVETHKSAHRLVDIERNSKVTRVGRLLRAIALDELPKLINKSDVCLWHDHTFMPSV
jgi:lipopolysaccharide/colanic/teichoic acid biosynthesis glycosyltransferase